jgi:S1-C subfamily serine protease
MSDTVINGGATITGTLPGSRAEKAGLRRGDRIVAINDVPVNNLQEVIDILGKGSAQRVSLIRGNTFVEVGLDMSVPAIDAADITAGNIAGVLGHI